MSGLVKLAPLPGMLEGSDMYARQVFAIHGPEQDVQEKHSPQADRTAVTSSIARSHKIPSQPKA
jgi:hypothetical protein